MEDIVVFLSLKVFNFDNSVEMCKSLKLRNQKMVFNMINNLYLNQTKLLRELLSDIAIFPCNDVGSLEITLTVPLTHVYELCIFRYWFVDREDLEISIRRHELLEYGDHQGELYGTKLDSVRQIISTGTDLYIYI